MQKRFTPDAGGVFPEWEEVTLGDILEINPKTEEKIADEFYYADLASINNGVFTHGAAINHNEAPGRAQRVVHIDDVLFQSVNAENLGHYHYTKDKELDKQFVASTGFFLLRMKNGCNAFLYQLLFTKAFNQEVHKYSAGSIYPAINITEFKKIKVRIPKSMEEQRKIAAALAAYDEMIAVKTTKLETWQECKKRMVKEIFGRTKRFRDDDGNEFPEWEEKTLGKVCESISDGSHFSPKTIKDGKAMLSVKDMKDCSFDLNDCKKISEEDFNTLVKQGCKPKPGDVLLSKDGSVFRYIFKVDKEIDAVLLSSIAIIRPDAETANADYLVQCLKNTYLTNGFLRKQTTGTAIKRVVLKNLKTFKIPLPCMEEQQKIGSFLAEIDKEIQIQKEFIRTYAEGKKRMMRELMEG